VRKDKLVVLFEKIIFGVLVRIIIFTKLEVISGKYF